MQRLVVVVSALVAIAVTAVVAVSVGAHAVHAQAAPSAQQRVHLPGRHVPALHQVAPSITVPGVTGHTCYVSVPRCSQTPCVEYIHAQPTVAVGVPGARLATSAARCPSPDAGVVTVTPRGPIRPSAMPNFSGALPGLAHKLQARPAGSP